MYKIIIVLNIVTFFTYGLDKYLAIKRKRRISEISLLILSIIAPFFALLGMFIFHHKTKKIKFYFTNLIALTIQLILIIN